MMLETASVKREEAMDELDEIRKRRKSLDKSTHKLTRPSPAIKRNI